MTQPAHTNPLADAPREIREELVRAMDSSWSRGWPEKRAATAAEAEQRIHEGVGYLLQMSWLGRTDKFSSQLRPALAWATETYMPADDLARDKGGRAAKGEPEFGHVRFPGQNHVALADTVMRALIESYRSLPGMDFPAAPEEPRRSWLGRILGR